MKLFSTGKRMVNLILRTFFLTATTCHAGQAGLPSAAAAAENTLAAFAKMVSAPTVTCSAGACQTVRGAIAIEKLETFPDDQYYPDNDTLASALFAFVAISPPIIKEKRHMPVHAQEYAIPSFLNLDLYPDAPPPPKPIAPKTDETYGEFGLTDRWVQNVIASVPHGEPSGDALRDEPPGRDVLGIAFVSVPEKSAAKAPHIGRRCVMSDAQAFPHAARFADDFKPGNHAADISGDGAPKGLYLYLYIPHDEPQTALRHAANVLEFMIKPEKEETEKEELEKEKAGKEKQVERGGYGAPPADDEQGGCLVLAR